METTLIINKNLLAVITRAARNKDVSRSEMMVLMMKKVMDEVTGPVRYGMPVKYQDRDKPGNWHTFHLQVREDDYEYLMDLRKLMKMSVSCILAYAARKYLKIINTDNNRYINYVVIKNIRDGIIFWTLIVGISVKHRKLSANIRRHLPSNINSCVYILIDSLITPILMSLIVF